MAGKENTKENSWLFNMLQRVVRELKKRGVSVSRQVLFEVLKPELSGKLVMSEETAEKTLEYYMENPLSPEEEAKTLKAILHRDLDKGNITPQMLEKLDRIIGVNTGEDEKVQIVDFSGAFPDIDTAVKVCMKMLEDSNETQLA